MILHDAWRIIPKPSNPSPKWLEYMPYTLRFPNEMLFISEPPEMLTDNIATFRGAVIWQSQAILIVAR